MHNSLNSSILRNTSNLQNSEITISLIQTPDKDNSPIVEESDFDKIKRLKLENPKNVSIAYLNCNFAITKNMHKQKVLFDLINNNIDIVALAETKLDESFNIGELVSSGYRVPFRLDVTNTSGGLLVYIREDIPCTRLICPNISKDIQYISFEINLLKQKWLITSIYRPPRTKPAHFIEQISTLLDIYSKKYDRLLVMGDFNLKPDDKWLKQLLIDQNLYNMIHEHTCFKSSEGSTIDLMLTNKKWSFKHTQTFETGISDHHRMIYTMLKSTFQKILQNDSCIDVIIFLMKHST